MLRTLSGSFVHPVGGFARRCRLLWGMPQSRKMAGTLKRFSAGSVDARQGPGYVKSLVLSQWIPQRAGSDSFPAVCVTPDHLGPLRYKITEVWSALPMPSLYIGGQTFGSCGHHLI